MIGGTALDAVTTHANQRDGYTELNPLYGKHASTGEVPLYRAVAGAVTYYAIDRAARKDPAAACKMAKIYTGISFLPGVVNIGVRIRF